MPGSVRRIRKFLLIVLFLVAVVWLLRASGPFLVVDNPAKSDVIVMLDGDENDVRYNHTLELLRAGFGPRALVDAAHDYRTFGKTQAQWAQEAIATAPPDVRGRLAVCPIAGESTFTEMASIRQCLQGAGARSVLIVTSDFHTRRALSVARKRLPEYQVSIAAARTRVSAPGWWRSRWALKFVFLEYEKLLWWKLVESHR